MSQDPYKYFRIEARELLEGLGKGLLDLEKGAGGKEAVGRLLRLAHTLKGASRVVKQSEIGDLAHAIEESLAPFREGHPAVPKARIDELLKLLDAIAGKLAALEPGAAGRTGPARASGEEPLETVRVELGEMDGLLEDVAETTTHLTALEADLEKLPLLRRTAGPRADGLEEPLTAFQRSLDRGVEQASKALSRARERVNRLRLLPASAIFASLERAARDAAHSLGRRAEFQSSGGESRLDAHVLVALRDALLHVVRNAVAHGIEPEVERLASGKDPVGRVTLAVERQGNRATFVCRDDGRGIDVEAVRRAALQKGLLPGSKAGPLSPDEAVELLLRGGLSTTGAVTSVSGRGIGLDVVRETALRLKGEVRVRTEKGRGTTLTITVPVSLSSLPAVVVEAGTARAAIPLDCVPTTRRITEEEVCRSPEGDSILHEGRGIPLLALPQVLSKDARASRPVRWRSIVVVRSGDDLAALEVDRVLGISSVVVRSLPSWIAADPVVAGAALDVRGAPQIVLDPAGLVRAARVPRARPEEKIDTRLPILVVDDSLTTRMLEQSILESAGYEVVLAVSGEEALSKARRSKFGIFLVDVEMPGMDGFEFVARVRGDPSLSAIPALLVTSRSSPEDRKRGEELGAAAFIVKSEFDQGRLLKIIQELMG